MLVFFFSDWNLISDERVHVVTKLVSSVFHGEFFLTEFQKSIRFTSNPYLILAPNLNVNLISSNGYKNSVMINKKKLKTSSSPI